MNLCNSVNINLCSSVNINLCSSVNIKLCTRSSVNINLCSSVNINLCSSVDINFNKVYPCLCINTIRHNIPATHNKKFLFILTATCFASSLCHHQAFL